MIGHCELCASAFCLLPVPLGLQQALNRNFGKSSLLFFSFFNQDVIILNILSEP